MKKNLILLLFLILFGSIYSQNTADRWRLGLRINPQTTWFSGDDKNNTPNGLSLGFGFGLNAEYKISNGAFLLTGIGGDFETGKYTFKNEANYKVMYWRNENTNKFITPVNDSKKTDLKNTSNTGYLLNQRTINTTFITIPLILKLSTSEINGLKYFGLLGCEIGIRIKSTADDTYHKAYTYDALGNETATKIDLLNNLDIGGTIFNGSNGDAHPIPIRLGLNAGIGTEYRLAGSTSLLLSVNYFSSFWNYLNDPSKNLVYEVKAGSTPEKEQYGFVSQNLILKAVRINIGIMF